MLVCKLATMSIDQKSKLSVEVSELVDKEMFQRLVNRLIYLATLVQTYLFPVSVVSRYMHDHRKSYMDAMYQILKYLKSAPGKGLIYQTNEHLNIEGYCDSD
jgi:uncharacterized membrane protein YhaH (DUF805 family)